MTEDVELTKRILGFYAEEKKFPSRIGNEELKKKFPEIEEQVLIAHLVWAYQAGMFIGKPFDRADLMGGPQYMIIEPDGLSKLGSDYVKYSRSGFWEKAKKYAKERSAPLTTDVLSKILPRLIEQSL